MAIVNKLQVFDEQDNFVDYDILASDVKFNDGKDLPTKLAEMEDEIGEGGYQPPATGIPKGDLEQSIQDTLDSVANKVDKEQGKGLSTEDFTAALKAKLEALDPYTKAEVNAAIQEAVEGLGGGSVESVTINGQTKTPDSQGNVDLGTIQGAKGDKGEKGDTVVIDPEGLEQFVIANDLDTSDPTQGLSARQGKILKQAISTVQANLQAVVDALANMAFTSAKPTLSQIDWTGGTFYATIVKSLTGCTATDNTNNGQIAEGQSLTMQLTADNGFTLTGATISVTNSKGQAVAYTLNGSTLTVANVTGTITVSVVAVGIFSVVNNDTNVNLTANTMSPTSGSSWTGTLAIKSGISNYRLASAPVVTMGGTAVDFSVSGNSWNSTTGVMTIGNVTGNIVITAVAEEVGKVTITKSLRNVTLTDNTDANGKIAEGATYNGTVAVEDRTGIKTRYTDTSFATNYPAGTFPPLKLTPAMIDGDGLTVSIAQDGLSANINGAVSSNKTITAVGETRMVRGRGIALGATGTPGASASQSRCMNETPILVPQGVNAYVVHHNFKTISEELVLPNNGEYNSLNTIADRVLTGDGYLGGGSSQGLQRTEDETVFLHDLTSSNKCVYIWFSFTLGLNDSTTELMQSNLERCWVKGYVLPSGETDITKATAEYLLFDGSKSTLIEQSE